MVRNMSYILAVGCSYTDDDFKSNKVEHEYFPKWPELLGNKLDLPVVNLGKCGASNDWIEKTIIDRIINDSYNIELVAVGFTETWRYSVYNKLHHNPLSWFDQADRTGGWDITMRVKSIPFYRSLIEEKFADTGFKEKENMFRTIVNNYIETIVRIQKICKDYGIKFIGTNLVDSFEDVWYRYCVKSLGKDFNYNSGQWAWMIQNSPNFDEVDENTLIGWPFHRFLGGYSINHDLMTEKDKIAPDKGDWHPNKRGHEIIASLYYDKYTDIYV